MRVAIIGAAGFLGRKLAARLAAKGRLAGRRVEALSLLDNVVPAAPPGAPFPVACLAGDVTDSALLARAIPPGTDAVFHLAAVVSAQAEAEFDLGLRANLDGTRAVLEAARAAGGSPAFVFTSSVAAYGGPLPEVVGDDTILTPQNSYGAQKAMGELLVADYARRGFVRGVAIRLPTIIVRPGRPNRAASGFASAIVREPLLGLDTVCPVPPELAMWVASPLLAVDWLLHAASLDPAALGARRSVNPPGISASMGEIAAALAGIAGNEAAGRIRWERDPAIERIVAAWPARFDAARARELGFAQQPPVAEIIRAFIAEDLGPTRAERGL
ncbi:MAG: SDR family oxidoreductase [Alphaproteobacteria bacterium]|nr:SDR family oxidoreductase [Alphaproteobacteria bacterium]